MFFSIEVTATFFYVHSLWKGILCAVCAKIAHSVFRGTTRKLSFYFINFVAYLPGVAFSAIFAVEQQLKPFSPIEFVILILSGMKWSTRLTCVGVVISFCGAAFTVLCKRYVMFRARYPWWKTSVWGQLIVASLLIGAVSYPSNDLTVLHFKWLIYTLLVWTVWLFQNSCINFHFEWYNESRRSYFEFICNWYP